MHNEIYYLIEYLPWLLPPIDYYYVMVLPLTHDMTREYAIKIPPICELLL